MSTGHFAVAVRDLESGHKILRSKIPSEWLRSILKDTEVEPHGEEGELSLTLSKNGVEVLVRGKLDVTVSVPCARTLDPAIYRLRPEVFLLLGPGPAPTASRAAEEKRARRRPETAKAGGGSTKSEGGATAAAKAKKSGKTGGAWDEDPELLDQDAARDTYSGDHVILDEFLREFILLEVPMVPLREDLRSLPDEASPSPPSGVPSAAPAEPKPLDPRLSPLAELKARLEKKKE